MLSPSRPLSHCNVEGTFFLFLPYNATAWGMLDLRRVVSRHPEINMSLISPLALAPHKISAIVGTARKVGAHLYGIDQDGSSWSLHCK